MSLVQFLANFVLVSWKQIQDGTHKIKLGKAWAALLLVSRSIKMLSKTML